jgi:hypothetical protein
LPDEDSISSGSPAKSAKVSIALTSPQVHTYDDNAPVTASIEKPLKPDAEHSTPPQAGKSQRAATAQQQQHQQPQLDLHDLQQQQADFEKLKAAEQQRTRELLEQKELLALRHQQLISQLGSEQAPHTAPLPAMGASATLPQAPPTASLPATGASATLPQERIPLPSPAESSASNGSCTDIAYNLLHDLQQRLQAGGFKNFDHLLSLASSASGPPAALATPSAAEPSKTTVAAAPAAASVHFLIACMGHPCPYPVHAASM